MNRSQSLRLQQLAQEAARLQAAHRPEPKEAALLKLLSEDTSAQPASASTSSASAPSLPPPSPQPPRQPQRPRELTPEELQLDAREEALVARVMAQHPALTYEEAVYDLRMAGM